MRVLVVGAGTVGYYIAGHLANDNHEVVVIDRDGSRLVELEDHHDVQTLRGDGCDPSILRQAMEGDLPDLLLAVTNEDAANLIMSFAAKRLGVPRVVARVRSRYFLDSSEVNFRDPLGIDLLLSPEILTALELAHFVENPAAVAIASLAQGRVQLRTVMLSPFSAHSTLALRDIRLPPGVLIAAIRRGKRIFTPHGDDTLETGDRVTLIGLPEVIDRIHPDFDTEQDTSTGRRLRVAIAGAGETGLFLARQLEARSHKVYVIDKNLERCEYAGERLERAIVLNGDCTNKSFLREEKLDEMDYFIAVTGDDESNIISALLAKELHVGKAACLIDRPDYARIVERVGIDVALSPRIVAANRVMTLLKEGKIRSVLLLEEGAIEVTEYVALASSPIVGSPLKDIELPRGALIGAVVHGDRVTIPRGSDILRPGDLVVMIAESGLGEEIDDLFRRAERRD